MACHDFLRNLKIYIFKIWLRAPCGGGVGYFSSILILMRNPFQIVLFCLCVPLFAGPVENELAALKAKREASLAKFTADLNKAYVKDLSKLQEKALNAKDLDGALAVRTELSGVAVSTGSASPKSFSSKDDIGKFLVASSFKYLSGKNKVFKMHENGSVTGMGQFLTSWKVTGNRELTFIGWNPQITLIFDMSQDWTRGKLNTKKSTKKDELSGEIVLNVESSPAASADAKSNDPEESNSDNSVFGRRY